MWSGLWEKRYPKPHEVFTTRRMAISYFALKECNHDFMRTIVVDILYHYLAEALCL